MTVISYEQRNATEIANRVVAAKMARTAATESLVKRSLEVALTDNPLAGVAAEQKSLDDALATLALLETALEQANAKETERLLQAQNDARTCALRAGRQHLSRGVYCAQELSTAMSNMLAAYHRLLECADAAAK